MKPKFNEDSNSSFVYSVVKNTETEALEGKTAEDEAFLLYMAIVLGDKQAMKACLKRLEEKPFTPTSDKDHLEKTDRTLALLTIQLVKMNTPEAIEQRYYLMLLINSHGIYSTSTGFKTGLNQSKERYEALNPLPDSPFKTSIAHLTSKYSDSIPLR